MMKKIKWTVLAALWILSHLSCASDECSNGKCTKDAEWGTSRLIALEPATGQKRWGVDFNRWESFDIRRLQDDGNSVVVVASDRCYDENQGFAFDLEEGLRVKILPDERTPDVNMCVSVTSPGVREFWYVNGYCVGMEIATGTIVAVELTDAAPLWKSEVGAKSLFVFDNVILALSEIPVGNVLQYRLIRLSNATGEMLWQKQQTAQMQPLGTSKGLVFVMDTKVFGLNGATGDMEWEYEQEGGGFDPLRDSGEVLEDTLFVKRLYFKESECE